MATAGEKNQMGSCFCQKWEDIFVNLWIWAGGVDSIYFQKPPAPENPLLRGGTSLTTSGGLGYPSKGHPTKLFYEKDVLWLQASAFFVRTALFSRHVYVTKSSFISTRTAPFHRKFTTEAQNNIKFAYPAVSFFVNTYSPSPTTP